MSTAVCIPCAPAQECIEDLDRYSLQEDQFIFVLVCPPGIVCNGSNVVFLLCCDGTTLQGDIPLGSSITRRNQIISGLVAECERRRSFCGNVVPPDIHPPPITLYYSAPASCTVFCPDGTPFTYTVPAGVFIASTFAEAQAAAKAYACAQAPDFLLCLGQFNACLCAGTFFSGTISIQSNHAPFRVSVISGSFPAGMQLRTSGNSVIVSGIPTTAATYSFAIRVTDEFGNAASKSYTIRVLSITTSSLPNFSVGVPYSYQLEATGGSGNYAWRVITGTLPAGISLSISGLLSGTPTSLVGGAVVFGVIDTTCEAVSRDFFQPRATLSTVAITELKTKRGYAEYVITTLGTLYKKITWSGQITQNATSEGEHVAGAKYVYNDATEIDSWGRFVSNHHKNLYVQCLKHIYPFIGTTTSLFSAFAPSVNTLLGYCWTGDSSSCFTCPSNEEDWPFKSDYQTPNPVDPPSQMAFDPSGVTRTPTTYHYSATATAAIVGIEGVESFPGLIVSTIFPFAVIRTPTIHLTSIGDFTAVMSDPVTDADAEITKQTIRSTMATAENMPNYLRGAMSSFLTAIWSRSTTVNFTINCTRLIPGQNYVVRYQLADSNGTVTAAVQTFEADATSHRVTGTVPTPEVGRRITIRNATISFL